MDKYGPTRRLTFAVQRSRPNCNSTVLTIRASLGISIHTQPGEVVRRWQFERAL